MMKVQDYVATGKQVRIWRNANGISLRQWCKLLKIDASDYSRYERFGMRPRILQLINNLLESDWFWIWLKGKKEKIDEKV